MELWNSKNLTKTPDKTRYSGTVRTLTKTPDKTRYSGTVRISLKHQIKPGTLEQNKNLTKTLQIKPGTLEQ